MPGLLAPQLWVKLGLAVVCGGAIGLERERSNKPAGLRTNMLICVGSTLMTMVSTYVALGYASAYTNADPGRIAAQIVSGVGFLGAGTIIQARGAVHGLTTAATIWVMAGVGLAIGGGAYAAALATTAVLLGILIVLGWLERRLERPRRYVFFHLVARRVPGLIDAVNDLAEAHHLHLESIRMERTEDELGIDFSATCGRRTRDALLGALLELDAVEEVRVNE